MTPHLTENAMELGYGNMDLETLSEIAKKPELKASYWKLRKTGMTITPSRVWNTAPTSCISISALSFN